MLAIMRVRTKRNFTSPIFTYLYTTRSTNDLNFVVNQYVHVLTLKLLQTNRFRQTSNRLNLCVLQGENNQTLTTFILAVL